MELHCGHGHEFPSREAAINDAKDRGVLPRKAWLFNGFWNAKHPMDNVEVVAEITYWVGPGHPEKSVILVTTR